MKSFFGMTVKYFSCFFLFTWIPLLQITEKIYNFLSQKAKKTSSREQILSRFSGKLATELIHTKRFFPRKRAFDFGATGQSISFIQKFYLLLPIFIFFSPAHYMFFKFPKRGCNCNWTIFQFKFCGGYRKQKWNKNKSSSDF